MYSPTSTDPLFDQLKTAMIACKSLSTATNPVAQRLSTLEPDAIDYVLAQYSQFPGEIVTLLKTGRDRVRRAGKAARLPKTLAEELDVKLSLNIGQELGTETPKTHFRMLCDGFEATLSLRPEDHDPQSATRDFLGVLKKLCSSSDPGRAMGAVYAMELTAIPELVVVRDVYIQRTTSVPPQVRQSSTWVRAKKNIEEFFDAHIRFFEATHEKDLCEVLEPAVGNSVPSDSFIEAFHAVLDAMETWWGRLEIEACRV